MAKPPEEGRVWEWRAFGPITETFAAKVRAYPVRLGISDLRGDDIYLIAPRSDQNIKLRRYETGCVLKLKLLFETRPGQFELYNESAEFIYPFPVALEPLAYTARLLGVALPEAALSKRAFGEAEFVKALAESSPAVIETKVSKKRSQYSFENGWLELADVKFATRTIQSVSINAFDIEIVKEMLGRLKPGDDLEPMNYVEACRRWG
jgi:hypothetical protein